MSLVFVRTCCKTSRSFPQRNSSLRLISPKPKLSNWFAPSSQQRLQFQFPILQNVLVLTRADARPQTRPKTALRRAWNPPSPLLPQQERVHIPTLKLTSFADAFQIAFWLYPDPFWEVWRPPRLLQDTSKSTQF